MKKNKIFQIIIIIIIFCLKNQYLSASEIFLKKNPEIFLYGKIYSDHNLFKKENNKQKIFITYGILYKLKFNETISSFWKIEHTPFKNKYSDNLFFENNISSNVFSTNFQENTIEYGKSRTVLNDVSDYIKNIPSFDKYFTFKNVILGSYPAKILTYRNKNLYNFFPGLTFSLQRIFSWNSNFIKVQDNIKNINNNSYGASILYRFQNSDLNFVSSYLKNYATYTLINNVKKYHSQFFSLGMKYEKAPVYLAILYGKKWHLNFDNKINKIFLIHEKVLSNSESFEFISSYNINSKIYPFWGYLNSKINSIDNNILNKIQEKNIVMGTSIFINENIEILVHYLLKYNQINTSNIQKNNDFGLKMSYKF
ncbi:outer membrane protein C [Wigglesworthia glossinidia endosymbiont of Glossina morsitans morsitans (Yale colony)]|uniref:Outer membrane protein C n=1 Tax=Wigglesworthia glossinidia endosymbiont of Glossina morsitans morsitans (Yale colony) TaxID=1142511 RepID=H6Q547_WIGGL|nr:porin [Wigglesworthia glossinidia]AFA41330.1 outer membrane protein C [Wigglesworthia glossinidia endosymbiont of Glossina morsitans morsitans (Yale colony)]